MKQQLSPQIVEQFNQLEKIQKQTEIFQAQLKEKHQLAENLFVRRQATCNHVVYQLLDLFLGTWIVEEYHCCICRKRISRKEFKGQPLVGSYTITSWTSFHKDLRSPEAFPIPPEYQTEADSSRRELSETEAEIATLENKISELQNSRTSIESDLKEAARLLINRLKVPMLECDYRSFFG